MDSKIRVLVVDDDPLHAKLAGRIGRYGGFEVKETNKPLDVPGLARAWQPDLIVADIVMPELDGTELCVVLKSDPETRDIPVLFVSGNPLVASFGRFVGAADYLAKPYTPVKLLRAMNRLLGRVVQSEPTR